MVPFLKRKSVTAGQTHAQCKYVSLSPCESVMYLLVKYIVIIMCPKIGTGKLLDT